MSVRLRRRTIWVLVAVASSLVIAMVMLAAAVPLSSNTLRHRIIATLSKRLNSDVELGDLHLSVFPRLRAEGANLRVHERGRPNVPPLIAIKSFNVDADLLGLVRKRVAYVKVDGLEISIPPDDDDDDDEKEKRSERARATSGEKPSKAHTDPNSIEHGVVIETLDANGARLIIIPRKAYKRPKVWDIHTLRLHNVGIEQAMPFNATLTNAVPPGEIKTDGSFGPWQTGDPGNTPLKGTFAFDRADLSVFKGIGGILSSRGTFGGTLDRIDVKGETNTPDFVVQVSGHPFPLRTKYHSVVDGTNGDTILERVDASFLQSSLVASGGVIDEPGHVKGRIVQLDVQIDHARVEDIMRMAVKTPHPPMVGALKLTTKFLLPPGENDVAERLQLDGQFAISDGRFANYDVQGKINSLSHLSRGRTDEDPKQHVLSDFQGRFKLANGRLALPELTFMVPGAKVELAGVYALSPETLNFHGTMVMNAKISETTSGFKSLLLKAVDPLFSKDGAGSVIPFKVEGTRNNPSFGLDVRRVFKRDEKS
jgi:hypothetical protein